MCVKKRAVADKLLRKTSATTGPQRVLMKVGRTAKNVSRPSVEVPFDELRSYSACEQIVASRKSANTNALLHIIVSTVSVKRYS